jgi:TonB family protein
MNSHPDHPAQLKLRTSKTPVVHRNKRRKWALSLSPRRLSSILLLCFSLLAGPTVITAQTLQPSPLESTALAENVSATARDKVQPKLSIARIPEHGATGGSSFIKRAVRGILRFTKSLFSAFGEGGTSVRKVEPESKGQDEVTISSAATLYSPGFDRPEDSAKAITGPSEKISKEKSPDEQISIQPINQLVEMSVANSAASTNNSRIGASSSNSNADVGLIDKDETPTTVPLQGRQNSSDVNSASYFSQYKPLIVSHPLVDAAIKKVDPDYPRLAKEARIQGKVEVRILVDREGNVVETYVVEGHPLLSSAAKKAAAQWKFKENFGFSLKQKRRYIEASLVFTFRLDR